MLAWQNQLLMRGQPAFITVWNAERNIRYKNLSMGPLRIRFKLFFISKFTLTPAKKFCALQCHPYLDSNFMIVILSDNGPTQLHCNPTSGNSIPQLFSLAYKLFLVKGCFWLKTQYNLWKNWDLLTKNARAYFIGLQKLCIFFVSDSEITF